MVYSLSPVSTATTQWLNWSAGMRSTRAPAIVIAG